MELLKTQSEKSRLEQELMNQRRSEELVSTDNRDLKSMTRNLELAYK
jgi:hypothetical protein